MYALIRHLGATKLLGRQAPLLIVALVVAELFYTFGSFTLECLGFLATWAVLDAVVQAGVHLVTPDRVEPQPASGALMSPARGQGGAAPERQP